MTIAKTLMSLLVKLGVDVGDYDKGLSSAENKAVSGSKNIASSFQKMSTSMLAVGGVMTAGVTLPVVMGLVDMVKEAAEAEGGIAELEAVIKSTGGAAGVTAKSVMDQAAALQKVTLFSDDATIKGQSMLLTFTRIGKEVFPEATVAMLNMAQKFGSMETASVQLGKALNDPILGVSALRRVGVMLSAEQEAQIKQFMAVNDIASAQKVILSELNTEFGGLAEAAGKTFTGQMEIFKNSIGEVKETIGTALLPALTELAQKLTALFQDPKFMEDIKQIASDLGKLSVEIVGKVIPAVTDMVKWFTGLPAPVRESIVQIILLTAALGPVLMVLATLANAVIGIIGLFGTGGGLAGVGAFLSGTVLPAVGAAFAAVGTPVIALIAAIAALVLAIVFLGDEAWNTLTMIGKIIEIELGRAMNSIAGFFKNAFTIDWSGIGRSIINGICSGINSSVGWLVNAAKNAAQAAYNAACSLLGIHSPSRLFGSVGKNMMLGLAEGIDRFAKVPIRASVGVTGSLAPAASAVRSPAVAVPSGGGSFTINVSYSPMMSFADEREIARKLGPAIRQTIREQGMRNG